VLHEIASRHSSCKVSYLWGFNKFSIIYNLVPEASLRASISKRIAQNGEKQPFTFHIWYVFDGRKQSQDHGIPRKDAQPGTKTLFHTLNHFLNKLLIIIYIPIGICYF